MPNDRPDDAGHRRQKGRLDDALLLRRSAGTERQERRVLDQVEMIEDPSDDRGLLYTRNDIERAADYHTRRDGVVSRINGRRSGFPQLVFRLLPPNIYYASETSAIATMDEGTYQQLVVALADTEFRQLLNAEGNYAEFVRRSATRFQDVTEAIAWRLRQAAEN